jgi:hypothetical protein
VRRRIFGALVMRVLQPTNLNAIEPVNIVDGGQPLVNHVVNRLRAQSGYGQPVRSVRSI